MYRETFSAGLVYRVVSCDKSYNIGNDVMVVEYMPEINHIVKRMIGLTMLGSMNLSKHKLKIDYYRSNSYSNHAN